MTVNGRALDSWIEGYLEFTDILPSPPILRKWAAISFVAAAMERRIWVRTMGSDLYPGLYVILVGPPGIGKGEAMKFGSSMLRAISDLHIGPSDMTGASLIDALNEATRRIIVIGDPPYVEFNSLTVLSRELGVLIPAWEPTLLNNLTDIWDGEMVDQKRRGRDLRIKILHPQINLLGATTPSYLNGVMPPGAWDQGFISRTILIYSGERTYRDPFEEAATPNLGILYSGLSADLKAIAQTFGKMSFTPEAAEAIRAWNKGGCQPEPSASRLLYYNTRRLTQLLKLSMISSISRSTNLVITLENYAEALNWLIEAETYMPDIFKAAIRGGDSTAMEDTWQFVWTLFAKERNPIAEHRIVHFLKERIPAHSVMRVIEIMVKSKMFEIVTDKNGIAGYKPGSKSSRMEGH